MMGISADLLLTVLHTRPAPRTQQSFPWEVQSWPYGPSEGEENKTIRELMTQSSKSVHTKFHIKNFR